MSETILEVKNVGHTYRDEDSETEALRDINLEVKEGEFVSIIGASGCGKTTLLRMIAGLNKYKTGEIILHSLREGNDKGNIGYVFQQKTLFDWMTIEQNIAYGLKARKVYKKNRILWIVF